LPKCDEECLWIDEREEEAAEMARLPQSCSNGDSDSDSDSDSGSRRKVNTTRAK
jgi:hypothetical protein